MDPKIVFGLGCVRVVAIYDDKAEHEHEGVNVLRVVNKMALRDQAYEAIMQVLP